MRGEAKTFRAKDGVEYTFLFDFEAMVAAEDAASAAFTDVVEGATGGRFGHLRALIYGGLKAYQPRVTLPQVAVLIEEEGAELGKALWPALESAAPKVTPENPRVGEELESQTATSPGRRLTGTGTRSSPRGSKKVSTKPASGSRPRAASR